MRRRETVSASFRAPAERSKTENSRLEAAVHVVGHEQQHAELLQSDELHVALVALTHLQPLQQGVRVHVGHDG